MSAFPPPSFGRMFQNFGNGQVGFLPRVDVRYFNFSVVSKHNLGMLPRVPTLKKRWENMTTSRTALKKKRYKWRVQKKGLPETVRAEMKELAPAAGERSTAPERAAAHPCGRIQLTWGTPPGSGPTSSSCRRKKKEGRITSQPILMNIDIQPLYFSKQLLGLYM